MARHVSIIRVAQPVMCRTQGDGLEVTAYLGLAVYVVNFSRGFDAHVQPANYATQLNDGVHPFVLFFGSPVRLHAMFSRISP